MDMDHLPNSTHQRADLIPVLHTLGLRSPLRTTTTTSTFPLTLLARKLLPENDVKTDLTADADTEAVKHS
jgi:hypothetical protein